MNAIVAIGGPPVFRVVEEYRAIVASTIWVLRSEKLRNPGDPLLRSLDALVEPFMSEYFAAEAQVKIAALRSHFNVHPFPTGELGPTSVANAVVVAVENNLAQVLALIVMLDRAHAIDPLELVVSDETDALGRAALAWARARALPAVVIPQGACLRRPATLNADFSVIFGERARRAYSAIDAGLSVAVGSLTAATDCATRARESDTSAVRRSEAKLMYTRKPGWHSTDVVIAFEPNGVSRGSALDDPDAFGISCKEMIGAFLAARASVPTLRLAIVSPDPEKRFAKEAAVTRGVFFAQEDRDSWFAGADIVVSADSARSIEAAIAGIPAVNLWNSANWYLGPAFAAEDGIIDVQPTALGATLVALAGDPDLRAQIAAIARDRLAGDAQSNAPATGAIARELAKRRRPTKSVAHKKKPDIMIYAPDYFHVSAGLRGLYRLCHLINMAGGDASIYPAKSVHPSWNTPARVADFTDQTIVVYPEIYHLARPPKRVVRWVLNVPGLLLNGPKLFDSAEMIFYYSQALRPAAQAATAEILSDERELRVYTIEPELFFNDRSRPRLYDCVFIGKGQALYDRVQPRESRDAFVIASLQPFWPASRAETADLLRGCRRLYSFDGLSAIWDEALICGVQLFVVRENGDIEDVSFDTSDYVRQFYDLSQVERFLRLVEERWG